MMYAEATNPTAWMAKASNVPTSGSEWGKNSLCENEPSDRAVEEEIVANNRRGPL
jgi:hypothetical protein